MPFGQPSGPPASAKQQQELLTLLHDAGHTDFRDAHGPMGFTQRQAAGRFTRDEAAVFIDALQEAQSERRAPVETSVPARRLTGEQEAIRRLPTEQLAAELRRRGWTVREANAL